MTERDALVREAVTAIQTYLQDDEYWMHMLHNLACDFINREPFMSYSTGEPALIADDDPEYFAALSLMTMKVLGIVISETIR